MIPIILLLSILFFSYIIWIGIILKGWLTLPSFLPRKEPSFIKASIVVAVRNEENNLPALMNSLLGQDYPRDYYEIVLVDDHSDDSSAELIKKYSSRSANISYVKLPEEKRGKKQAIFEGVNHSKHQFVVTTDSDSVMGPHWLSGFSSYYLQHKPSLIAGPLLFRDDDTFAGSMLQLELISLVSSSAGAINARVPVMCSGANLAFEKEAYMKAYKKIKGNVKSGDDVFLLHAMADVRKDRIHFIKSLSSLVYIFPEKTIKDFFNQRVRWASKSRYYNSFSPFFTATLVLVINLSLALLFFSSFFNPELIKLFGLSLLIKSIVDFPLLYSASVFFKKSRLIRFFIPAQFFYFLYVTAVFFLTIFIKFRWKDR